MNAVSPETWYRARTAHWSSIRDIANRRGTLVSRLRLASFLGGAALMWWGLAAVADRLAAVTIGVAAFAGFGILVFRHARIIEEVERAEAAIALSLQGLARLARDWKALPEVAAPPDLDAETHPYARDLDLFGHASLAKWIGRPATSEGTQRLWGWLLAPAAAEDIADRQGAITELAGRREWRESLDVEGARTVATPEELRRFLHWAEGVDHAVPSRMQVVAIALPVATWILAALFFTDVIDAAVWLVTIVLSIVVSFVFAVRIYAVFDRVTV